MSTIGVEKALRTNKEFYSSFWTHRWKYRLMYDMQIKKKLFLAALVRARIGTTKKRVLDIGFGSGDILFTFDTSCELTGVDFSQRAVDEARQYAGRKGYGNSRFLQLDLDTDSLPFEDGTFDLVVCSHVLEHVKDDGKVIREIRRTLRDDGTAVILIPINERPGEDPNHARIYTTDSFLSQLESIGFKPTLVRENEYVGHLTSWFFIGHYHKRIPVLGFLISGLLNVPLALLPFRVHLLFDRVLRMLGYKPRQVVYCLSKRPTRIGAENVQPTVERDYPTAAT